MKFIFFGSSPFSKHVLAELEASGLKPVLSITSARTPLDLEKLKELDADIFVVASFGKILPKEIIDLPKYKTLNIHPSLLPKLRGPSPIQTAILEEKETGVSIIRLDEEVDHGPILAEKKVPFSKWPLPYTEVEQTLAKAGAELLVETLPKWSRGEIKEMPQDEHSATFSKKIEKEDGLINLEDSAEINLRKICAYEKWPGAYFFFTKKNGQQVRVVVKSAEIKNGEINFLKVIPEGKKEMLWADFLRGN